MAAGCSDGHGAKFFEQGVNWDFVNKNLGGNEWIWFKIRNILSKLRLRLIVSDY